MIIPVLFGAYLFFYQKRWMLWWEFLIPFGASFLLIVIFKYSVETVQTADTEYWGNTIVRVEYYEDWNEYIQKTCEDKCCCDKDGNNCTITYYDCSYVDYHPARYVAIDSQGEEYSISSDQYASFVRKFGQPTFTELSRNYHTDDGDLWTTTWGGSMKNFEPITTSHTYENRPQVASSVFSFPTVTEQEKKEHKLFEYPEIRSWRKLPGILADSAYAVPDSANILMNWLNSTLGDKKQVRSWLLVYRNAPAETGYLQEAYWKGGNKNEVIVMVSLDNANKVQWVKVSSWCEVELLKIEIRNHIKKMKVFDPVNTVKFMHQEINAKFVRKQFKDFDYLTVEPPTWAIIVTFIVTLLANIGTSLWLVKNHFNEEEESEYDYTNPYRHR